MKVLGGEIVDREKLCDCSEILGRCDGEEITEVLYIKDGRR